MRFSSTEDRDLKKRSYIEKFEKYAVVYIVLECESVASVAEILVVNANLLYGWKRRYLNEVGLAAPGKRELTHVVAATEFERLRKELGRSWRACEIQKNRWLFRQGREMKHDFINHRSNAYAWSDSRALLANLDMIQNMSVKGNCYDNAAMESFNGASRPARRGARSSRPRVSSGRRFINTTSCSTTVTGSAPRWATAPGRIRVLIFAAIHGDNGECACFTNN